MPNQSWGTRRVPYPKPKSTPGLFPHTLFCIDHFSGFSLPSPHILRKDNLQGFSLWPVVLEAFMEHLWYEGLCGAILLGTKASFYTGR